MTDSRTTSESNDYLLGMAPAEVARLADQHEVWRGPTSRLWARAGVREGGTVVDLGCGPGFTALDLAAIVGPEGRVIGVDASARALAEFGRAAAGREVTNASFVHEDVTACDPAGWNADVIFSRWLFCFLPDPAALVHRLAAGMRPGARLAVMDYAHYLAVDTQPSAPIVGRVFRAVDRSWTDAGGSLDVAGRLPAYLSAAGFRDIGVESLGQVGGPGSPVWRWVSGFLRLYLPTLVEKGYLSADEHDTMREFWTSLEADPGALFFAPPVLGVIGTR